MPPIAYEEIFRHNEKWVSDKLAQDPAFFRKMSVDQKPDYLFIGCSDSRADPDVIAGFQLGDVFVHRNVANIVNPIDLNVASVIQYAIQNLNVKHIIVCGHYGCGGIDAAMKQEGLGKGSPWLETIRSLYRIHRAELDAIAEDGERYDRLVELNVIEQGRNVLKMDCMRERFGTRRLPDVHAWVYDMRTGRIIDLDMDVKGEVKKLRGGKEPFLERVAGLFGRKRR